MLADPVVKAQGVSSVPAYPFVLAPGMIFLKVFLVAVVLVQILMVAYFVARVLIVGLFAMVLEGACLGERVHELVFLLD